jgi:hypothetical protein
MTERPKIAPEYPSCDCPADADGVKTCEHARIDDTIANMANPDAEPVTYPPYDPDEWN